MLLRSLSTVKDRPFMYPEVLPEELQHRCDLQVPVGLMLTADESTDHKSSIDDLRCCKTSTRVDP